MTIEFIHPITKVNYNLDHHTKKFNDLYDLYIDDENKLSDIQSDFYNDVQFPNYNNIDDFGSLIEKTNRNLFVKKLDNEIGFGKKILEAGCGTGQFSISLSRFNREIIGIDLSKGSLLEANKFVKKNYIKNINFYRMNIFNLFFKKNTFDVVISNGVLHHTHNCRKAFGKIVEVLKPNGLIVVGLYHKYGRLVQKIRQLLFPILGEKLKYLDKRFKENISDKKKYAWFLDQYNNPFETTHTYSEVIKWFEEENITFISSLPFDYNDDKDLLEKRSIKKGFKLFLEELSLMYDSNNIYEGGFFIMIGRKKI